MSATAPSYRDLRVIVTGAAGAIGGNLVRALAASGAAEILALDDLSQGVCWNIPEIRNVTFLQGSILDQNVLKSAFRQKPAIVFHLAALFANQNSIDHPVLDLKVNGQGILNILISAANAGRPRVVFASTSAAADGLDGFAVDDDAPPLGHGTPYQITKALGEQYCRFFHSYYGIPIVLVRFFNSYGPGEVPGRYRNVIPNFFYRAKRGEALPVIGTGNQTRDWTFVADVVDGLLKAGVSDTAVGHSVNLGTGQETTVIDIAREINMLTGNVAGIVYRENRRWDHHCSRVAATTKAVRLLDHECRTGIKTGLENTAQWFDENWSQIQRDVRF